MFQKKNDAILFCYLPHFRFQKEEKTLKLKRNRKEIIWSLTCIREHLLQYFLTCLCDIYNYYIYIKYQFPCNVNCTEIQLYLME